ncbi:diguanylate cyclase (GGDEF)-like protein [Bosea sp. 124]|nr:diguanylate cyclase (GGDEF)-like protein [Bosea sp. 124]
MAAVDAALSHAPSEAYANQRARGFKLLRFAPLLEAEYLSQMRLDQRISALICTSTALVIWVAFAVFDVTRLSLKAEFVALNIDAIIVICLRVLTMTVLAALLTCLISSRLLKIYGCLSFLCLVMIGATAAINANVYKLRGLPQADLAEFAIIMAVFLPIGMTFRQSLMAATSIALTVTLAGWIMLDAQSMAAHLRFSAMLFFAAFVGAVGAYLREYAQRDKFLLRRLLHHLAMHDPLTGIGNRRHFEEQVVAALQQARREGAAVTLAVLDIDHFKSYNDRYGHHAGDLALKQVAQCIAHCLRRPLDIAGRMGGEEFGVLLYGADYDDGHGVIKRIVTSVADLNIHHGASSTADRLTVSIGAALFDGSGDLESLYRRADAVLYNAKAAGRNQALMEKRRALINLASRAHGFGATPKLSPATRSSQRVGSPTGSDLAANRIRHLSRMRLACRVRLAASKVELASSRREAAPQ